MAFRVPHKVMFQHCDPAGIIFYPRYFEMINATVEEWFEHLGYPFSEMHGAAGTGIPMRHIEVSFEAPSRLGEMLAFDLSPRAPGRTSLGFSMVAHGGDVRRLVCTGTVVHMDKASGRPKPWPEMIRAAMAREAEEDPR